MSGLPVDASGPVAELRKAFDESFAAPPPAGREPDEDLLCFRVRGDAYAFRVREIAGVAAAGRVVPVPSRQSWLLGVAGHGGSVVPVVGLAGLLGYPAARETPRWLALAGGRDPLAFALGELEGFRRVPRGDLRMPGREPGRHVHRLVQIGSAVRAILEVESIVRFVKEGARPAGRL